MNTNVLTLECTQADAELLAVAVGLFKEGLERAGPVASPASEAAQKHLLERLASLKCALDSIIEGAQDA